MQNSTKRVIAEFPDGRRFWVNIPIKASSEEVQRIIKEQLSDKVESPLRAPLTQASAAFEAPSSIPMMSSHENTTNLASYSTGRFPKDASVNIPQVTRQGISASAIPLEIGAGIGAAALASSFGAPALLAGAAGSVAMPVMNKIIRNYLGQEDEPNYVLPEMGGAGNIIEKAAMNEVGGRAIGIVGKGIRAFGMPASQLARETGVPEELINLGGTTGQLLGKETRTGRAVGFLEDTLAYGNKLKSVEASSQNITSEVAAKAAGAKPILDVKPFNSVNASPEVINSLLKNNRELKTFLRTGRVKLGKKILYSKNAGADLQGYIMKKVIEDSTEAIGGQTGLQLLINGEKAVNQFRKVLLRQEASKVPIFSKAEADNFAEFLNAAAQSTDIGSKLGAYFSLNLARTGLSMSGAILAGKVFGVASPATVIGGFIGMSGLAKILANRKAAPIFLNMVKGRPLGMSLQAASRIFINSLSGQPITLQTTDGKEVNATVGSDGQIREIDPYKNLR